MGPSGSSGTGTGSTANVYTPQAQPTADFNFGQLIQPMINSGISGETSIGNPAAQNYPTAQAYVDQFLTGSPYTADAMAGAQGAADYGTGTLAPMGYSNTGALSGAGNSALNYGLDPTYNAAISALQNNPFYAGAQTGANNAAQIGGAGAQNIAGQAGAVGAAGQNPMYAQLAQFAESNPYYAGALGGSQAAAAQGQQGGAAMQSAGNQILDAGFDPQSALFDRTRQQTMDSSNAANAAAGIGSTPYGASVTSNALGNFGINWQNQQLGRETQAAGAASPLFQAAPGLTNASAALPSQTYMNQLGNIGSTLNNQLAAGISGLGASSTGYGNAANLAASSAAAPNTAFTNQIGQVLQALNSRNQAANAGTAAGGSALTSAQNLGGTAAQQGATLAGLPYSTGTNFANNALSGLGTLTNLGNNAYALPQQAINDLESYMGLGQSASNISGALGQMGVNQLASGVGGGLSAANSLVGNNGLLTGAGGLGGLLGSTGAAAAATDAAGAAVPLGSLAAVDAGGGGASGLLGLAPFAAS